MSWDSKTLTSFVLAYICLTISYFICWKLELRFLGGTRYMIMFLDYAQITQILHPPHHPSCLPLTDKTLPNIFTTGHKMSTCKAKSARVREIITLK